MGFGQLYYTSCRTGLAGFPGYQFNAATAGIAPEVMRDVEALTAYEAPRSLTAAGSDTDRYPVNLCHLPGETTVVANVAFVGEDYSRRSGNYFAHALVTRAPERDLAGCLPIELWRSPGWVEQPVEYTDLPELAAPPPRGGLTPATVADYLAGSGADHHLAVMLTAAELAIRAGERKVVIIAEDDDAVAHWIAALSYLLPRDSVRRLSFMTYSRQPRYSRTIVVGALPEVDIERGSGFDSYFLFDLEADRSSDVAVHPLARLLADVGVAAGPELWERVERFVTGGESGFTELYPAAVAATVGWSGRPERLEVEPLPLVDWLERAGDRLDPELIAAVGDAATTALTEPGGGDASTVNALRRLAVIADGNGLAQLVAHVEVALVDLLVHAAGGIAEGVTLRSEVGRRHAADELGRRLLAMPAATAFPLLLWAHQAGLRMDSAVLFRAGVTLAGPAVLDRPDGPLRAVLRAWLPVRQGAVEHLGTVADKDLDRVVEFLVGPGAALVELDHSDLDTRGELAEAAFVADVRTGHLPPAKALRAMADRRRRDGRLPGVDEPMLSRLWPANLWTCAEAIEIVNRLDPLDLAGPAVNRWLGATVLAQPPLSDLHEYLVHQQLCGLLSTTEVGVALEPTVRERVLELLTADGHVERVLAAETRTEFDRRFQDLHRRLPDGSALRRQRVEDELLRGYPRLSAGRQATLVMKLATYRQRLFSDLVTRVADHDDLLTAGTVWCLRQELLKSKSSDSKPALDALDRRLLPVLKRWRRRDLRRLGEHLERLRARDAAATLALWSEGDGAGFVSRMARNVWTHAGWRPDGKNPDDHGKNHR